MLSKAWHKVTKKSVICKFTRFFYQKKKKDFAKPLQSLCGKTGIRTLETLLTFTHFPGVPLQPLEHLSVFEDCKDNTF